MSNKDRYRELMVHIHQWHKEFSAVWNSVRTAELQKHNIDSSFMMRVNQREIEKIWEANGVAYRAASAQAAKRDELFRNLFEELPHNQFLQGNPKAIDEIISFLEIDVIAFRCGYAKEFYFHKLKSLSLNQNQINRLQGLALTMCQNLTYRREFTVLIRLMIKLADKDFIDKTRSLLINNTSKHISKKTRRMIEVILNNRPDLK
jgi:hypothetical protein